MNKSTMFIVVHYSENQCVRTYISGFLAKITFLYFGVILLRLIIYIDKMEHLLEEWDYLPVIIYCQWDLCYWLVNIYLAINCIFYVKIMFHAYVS